MFDTETISLPKDYKQGPSANDNWPRVHEIAWQRYNEKRELVHEYKTLIKPKGWEVPKTMIKDGIEVPSFQAEYGYSTEECEMFGEDIAKVLSLFSIQLFKSKYIIAHNMSFDLNVVASEMIRTGLKVHYPPGKTRPKKICTKDEGTDFCAIPNPHKWAKGFKWCKLEELHMKLFNEEFEDAHDALGDVKALARCFFGLVDAGVITP